MKPEKATFYAVIPSTQSAIRVHGESGGRIEFDVDDTSIADMLKLVLWRDRLLKVTVEPETDGEPNNPRALHI